MESDNKTQFTVTVYEDGTAEIDNTKNEEKKKDKITVENNLQAPIVVIVKKIYEDKYKGYEIQIYNRTKKDMEGANLVTAVDKLVIMDE